MVAILIGVLGGVLFSGNVFEMRTNLAVGLIEYTVSREDQINSDRLIFSKDGTIAYSKISEEFMILADFTRIWSTAPRLLGQILKTQDKAIVKICFWLDGYSRRYLDWMLQTAVHQNDGKKVKRLLYLGANPDVKNEKGQTPLYVCAIKNKVNIAKMLVDGGADLNTVLQKGWTPLNASIYYHHNDLARFLMESGASIDTNKKNIKKSPLWMAVKKGNDEVFDYLLAAGVDTQTSIPPDSQYDLPMTILLYAINRDQYDMAVKLILEDGPSRLPDELLADYPQITNYCLAGVQRALRQRAYHAFELGESSNPIISAITAGKDVEEIEKIIDENPGLLDKDDAMGDTPLIAAVTNHLPAIVQYLKDKGCDLTKTDGNGYSPALLAVEQNSLDILKMLIDDQFDSNTLACRNDSLLHFLVMRDLQEPLKIFIENGVELDVSSSSGTPLHFALQYHDRDHLAKLLLEGGADPTINSGYGNRSPLEMITQSNKRDELKKLVEPYLQRQDSDGSFILQRGEQAGPSKLHVVSVYQGTNENRDQPSRIPVKVTDTEKPVQLLFLSYEPVIWQLHVDDGVVVERVYTRGYYSTEVTGLDDSVELIELTREAARDLGYEGLDKKSAFIKQITVIEKTLGIRPSTIQGKYEGLSFLVDGEKTINYRNSVLNRPPEKDVRLVGEGNVSGKGTILRYGQVGANSSAMANVIYNGGKWYFEAIINPEKSQESHKMSSYTNVGLFIPDGDHHSFALSDNAIGIPRDIRRNMAPGCTVGVAADLDEKMIYFSINGEWLAGSPENGDGIELREKQDYTAGASVSSDSNNVTDVVVMNFGVQPFKYPIPDGFLSYDGKQGNE